MTARQARSLAALAAVLAAAGCGGPSRFIAESFERAPAGWREVPAGLAQGAGSLEGRPLAKGDVRVEGGRLVLEGRRVLLADMPFEDVRGFADFTPAGGALEGTAGLFLEETRRTPGAAPRRAWYTIALNGSGSFGAYEGFPERPVGAWSWSRLADAAPGQPVRLGLERRQGAVRFTVDGRLAATFRSEEGGGGRAPAGAPVEARVGVFAALLTASVDNFTFGDRRGAQFDPEAYVLRETAEHGEFLLREARAKAAAARRTPSRAALLAAIEAFCAARRAFHSAGAGGRARDAEEEMRKELAALEPSARAARCDDLLTALARSLAQEGPDKDALSSPEARSRAERAREREAAGERGGALIEWLAAEALEPRSEASTAAARLRPALEPPLAFHLEVGGEALPPELAGSELWEGIRSIYGGLPDGGPGSELYLEVAVREARAERQAGPSRRIIEAAAPPVRLNMERRRELERLEKSFPEDLADAVERARTARLFDLHGPAAIAALVLEGKPREVLAGDAPALKKIADRLRVLRVQREEERQLVPQGVSVEGRLIRDSVGLKLSCRLLLARRVLWKGTVEARGDLEQWEHPEAGEGSIPESQYSEEEAKRVRAAVLARASARLADGLALERLLSAVPADEATLLLIRMARASPGEPSHGALERRLRSVHGLEGPTLRAVEDGLYVSAGGSP